MHKVRIALPLLVSAAILFYITDRFDLSEIGGILVQANKIYLTGGIILILTAPFILAWRWLICLTDTGFDLSYRQILPAYLASVPIAKFSPGNVGDLSRAILLPHIPKITVAGVVIFENLLDILALCILALIGGIIMANTIAAALSLGTAIVIILTVFLLPRLPVPVRWRDKLTGALSLPLELFRRRTLVLRTLALSILAWLIVLGFLALAFLSFDTPPPLGTLITRQPHIILAGILPLSFSGVGIRETGMLAAYQGLAPDSTILAVALTHSFFGIVVLPLLCLPWTIFAIKRFRYGKS
jgi:glycosyltransferase 2 family protein